MARHALVIGSNGAANLERPLSHAVSDACAIAETLGSDRCGFAVELIRQTPDLNAVKAPLDNLSELTGMDDEIVVYFAGHGEIISGKLWLMLDQSDRDRPSTYLEASYVFQVLDRSRAARKLLILDCCHSGSISRAGLQFLGGGRVTGAGGIDVDAAQFQVLMASEWFGEAREIPELNGGFLTMKICEALGSAFGQADLNGDLALDLDELVAWLRGEANAHNKANPERQVQVPKVFGNGSGPFLLTQYDGTWPIHEIAWPDRSTLVALPGVSDEGEVLAIGKWPVTNAQYRRFVAETGWPPPVGVTPASAASGNPKDFSFNSWRCGFAPWDSPPFDADALPVVCVTPQDVEAYCHWVSTLSPCPTILPTPLMHTLARNGSAQQTRRGPFRTRSGAPDGLTAPKPAGDPADVNEFGVGCLEWNIYEWTDTRHIYEYRKPRGGYGFPTNMQPLHGESFSRIHRYDCRGGSLAHETRARFDAGFRIASKIGFAQLPSALCIAARALDDGTRELREPSLLGQRPT